VRYDLSRLGPVHFEELAQALLLSAFGVRTPPFPTEPSKYRQIVLNSERLAWPPYLRRGIWDGRILIRLHFVSPTSGRLGKHGGPQEIIGDGFEAVRGNQVIHSTIGQSRQPSRYILLITNAKFDNIDPPELNRLRSDQVDEYGLSDFAWLGYDELGILLDKNGAIRREFAGFITSSDGLRRVHEYIEGITEDFTSVINRHIAMEMMADQWIRLTQAGDPAHGRLELSRLAIDLPLQRSESDLYAANYIIDTGNRVRRRSSEDQCPPHVVMLGGPGQGKSTIGQLVCQAYRAALLGEAVWLDEGTLKVLKSIDEGLDRIGVADPMYRRWPIRIDLSTYADAAMNATWKTILRYISEQVASRTSIEVSIPEIRAWLHGFPWLVVLDGLDEVASALARDTLMDRISDFLIEAGQEAADLLLFITTRPQGYAGEFTSDLYEHLTLDSLTPLQAAAYAKHLATVRHADDPDMCKKLVQRTEIASKEESTARLMRSPLQVTIISLLLEARERAPQARYALFEAYYETIYSREAAKPGSVGRLLQEQRSHINALHDRVGLVLQVESEKTGGADAMVSQSHLRALAIERLRAEGYEHRDAARLSDDILTGVTKRLVLIVPKALEDVGFEVRSIQEFFAARAIVSGSDESVVDRLRNTMVPAHWRNTWLLAAGRVFAQREHIRLSLIALLSDIDTACTMNVVVAPGADLALDLLDDDLSATTPRFQRMFAERALTLLNCPPDQDLERRASILWQSAVSDSVIRASAEKAIGQAMQGTPAQACSARIVQRIWSEQDARSLFATGKEYGRRRAMPGSEGAEPTLPEGKRTMADLIYSNVEGAMMSTSARETANELVATLSAVPIAAGSVRVDEASVLASDRVVSRTLKDACFSTPTIADAVASSAIEAGEYTWPGASELRNMMRSWLQRQPVGDYILSSTPFT